MALNLACGDDYDATLTKLGCTLGSALAVVAAATPPVTAMAGATATAPLRVASLVDVSAVTSPAGSCADTGSEGEVTVASDPTDPRRILLGYLQGHNATVVLASSRDAGRHWTLAGVPGLSSCTGGSSPRVVDPFVSIGGDHRGYLGAIDIPSGAATLSSSPDGEMDWQRPLTVDSQPGDWEWVLADPVAPSTVRLSWTSYTADPVLGIPIQSRIRFATSVDGGRSINPPVVVHEASPGQSDIQTTLVHVPGALVDVFGEAATSSAVAGDGSQHVLASRSIDNGATWDAAADARTVPDFPIVDPDSGSTLRAHCCPFAVAAEPGGGIDIVFVAGQGAHTAKLMLRRSTDGGATWGADETIASVPGQAFSPAIAVAANGRIGVLWQDMGADHSGDPGLTVETAFASSGDEGRTWVTLPLGSTFDLRADPVAQGTAPLGDYTGLTTAQEDFIAGFPQGPPAAQQGPSDVFAARLTASPKPVARPKRRHRHRVHHRTGDHRPRGVKR